MQATSSIHHWLALFAARLPSPHTAATPPFAAAHLKLGALRTAARLFRVAQ